MSSWAHDPHVTFKHGFAVVTCKCGMNSGKIDRHLVETVIAAHRAKYLREPARPR